MKNKNYNFQLLIFGLISLVLNIQDVFAGKPLCLFTPLTATTLTVPVGAIANVSYLLTNQSKKTHTFKMRPIPGITQITSSGNCPTNFTLAYQQSCVLNLSISGADLDGDVDSGPDVCDHGNPLLCYRPGFEDNLHIVKDFTTYFVGGVVSGLEGTLVLLNNGGDPLSIDTNGDFFFPEGQNVGSTYEVTIQTQPENQLCVVANGTGIVGEANVNNVQIECNDTFTVGGDVFGLSGSELVLTNNKAENITLSFDDSFVFSYPYISGDTYQISVASQPAGQTCTVNDGVGEITDEDVDDITVICSANAHTVGGNITGLDGTLGLVNDGQDPISLTSTTGGTTPFTFPTPVAEGADYNVTVSSQPSSQICTVSGGQGTVGTSDVNSVQVTCSTVFYTVGGNINGLTGTVVLQNNGGDNLPLSQDGNFAFPTPVAQNAPYNVTVLTNPPGQTCEVVNGTGTTTGNINNVQVNCTTNNVLISASLSELALSIKGITEYGVVGTPSSGVNRTIAITNSSSQFSADNLAIQYPSWPSGTTASTTCTSTLAPGATCTITVNPGTTASTNGSRPCNFSGTAPLPEPNTLTIKGINTNQLSIPVYVLGYSCIYKGGYIFAFDDTPVGTESVAGKIVTRTTIPSTPATKFMWSTSNEIVYGIDNTSSSTAPSPTQNQKPGQVGCNARVDGACNTQNINILSSISGVSYAAKTCQQEIEDSMEWYLPALCELVYNTGSNTQCGTSALAPITQNIARMLIGKNITYNSNPPYWSSTEAAQVPLANAWRVFVYTDGTAPQADTIPKITTYPILCARIF